MAQYTKVPDHSHSDNELMPLNLDPADPLAPVAMRSQINPPRDEVYHSKLEKVYLFWIVGASCDGCTISVTGATHPRLEDLLLGRVPGLPKVELIHTCLLYTSPSPRDATLSRMPSSA